MNRSSRTSFRFVVGLSLFTFLASFFLFTDDADALRAALSLNPVELQVGDAAFDWWIISDLDDQLRRGPARPDHVMGVGGATRSLIAQAPLGADTVSNIGAGLDLGTGCGIVALALARAGVSRVVATDISPRALDLVSATVKSGNAS